MAPQMWAGAAVLTTLMFCHIHWLGCLQVNNLLARPSTALKLPIYSVAGSKDGLVWSLLPLQGYQETTSGKFNGVLDSVQAAARYLTTGFGRSDSALVPRLAPNAPRQNCPLPKYPLVSLFHIFWLHGTDDYGASARSFFHAVEDTNKQLSQWMLLASVLALHLESLVLCYFGFRLVVQLLKSVSAVLHVWGHVILILCLLDFGFEWIGPLGLPPHAARAIRAAIRPLRRSALRALSAAFNFFTSLWEGQDIRNATIGYTKLLPLVRQAVARLLVFVLPS